MHEVIIIGAQVTEPSFLEKFFCERNKSKEGQKTAQSRVFRLLKKIKSLGLSENGLK